MISNFFSNPINKQTDRQKWKHDLVGGDNYYTQLLQPFKTVEKVNLANGLTYHGIHSFIHSLSVCPCGHGVWRWQ